MNLHINVIRGCCVHGYFQQRGCEDVKHAKPLCIYANWASFPNVNMNLAEMNLFTSSHLRHPRVVLRMRKKCAAACLHIEHTAWWDIWGCGFPVFLPFDSIVLLTQWILWVCLAARLGGKQSIWFLNANIRFWKICQRGYCVTNPKGLSCSLLE